MSTAQQIKVSYVFALVLACVLCAGCEFKKEVNTTINAGGDVEYYEVDIIDSEGNKTGTKRVAVKK